MMGAPNISNSGWNQPHTMLSAKRPLEMWSMVVACFAAMIGWTVGTCDVENTAAFAVASDRPAAQVYVSKHVPLKLVGPPKPFQRATGTSASKPAWSASLAMARVFGQLVSRWPSAMVIAQPLLTFPPKTPSFILLPFQRGLLSRRLSRGVLMGSCSCRSWSDGSEPAQGLTS